MSYLTKDFLLQGKTAKKLYFDYAQKMPIFDYHCHLSEYQILENKPFQDIFEVWLAGDHYKWRLMRNYGIDEERITGNASHKEKFLAYCEVIGTAFGNPLYHWSQVELETFFECTLEINKENADKIWNQCNEYIQKHNVTPQSLIESSNVSHIFTTNEVFDDLAVFEKIAKKDYKFSVRPAFRGDKIMNIDSAQYLNFIHKLEDKTFPIRKLADLEKAIENRLKAFMAVGCVASDIALEEVYPIPDRFMASAVFAKALLQQKITDKDAAIFKGYLTYFLMKLYGQNHIRTEIHIGAMRNNNTKMFELLGADTGYDSVSDKNSTTNLSKLLNKLETKDQLPPVILFNLNPKMNWELMTLLGCFQDSTMRGKIQYGPAWWFLDNKEGMENHLKALTSLGHLATFVGMLTDSRSLLSYPRHHYFRRILCNYLGNLMDNGEITQNLELVGKVVENISYNNSVAYFNIQ